MTKKEKTPPAFTVKGIRVIFFAISDTSFSHRVIFEEGGQRVAKGWLSNAYRPCAASARYFYDKLVLGQDKPETLKRAEVKPKKYPAHTKNAFLT
jgi:hypothetical protein